MNAGFLLAFVFLLIISVYSYSNTNLLVKNTDSVTHTYAVKEAVEEVISQMKDMETGQRGFIITGNPDYLAPYLESLQSIEQTLENLQRLTSDNSVQQAYIKEFMSLKNQKIEKMQESIELRKQKGLEAARQILLNNSGKILMDQMRDVVAQMRAEEDRLLNIRNDTASESTRVTMLVITVGGFISLFIILIALVVLNRAETQRLAASLKLESQNRIRSALIELNEKMQGEQSLGSLAKNVLEKIAGFLDVKVGALYLADETGLLKFTGGYAFQPSNGAGSQFRLGEGLVGQAAVEKSTLTVANAPEDYFKISSGLGEAKPKFIHVVPLIHEGEVKGVAELGTFSPLSEDHLEFLNLTADRIAVAFNSAQVRLKMAELLQETQAQAEELQTQQEELRTSNEVLSETTRELEAQQEELRQANEELEEQRSGLEEQAEVVSRASRYKSEFLANMSHELRTPLNSQLILSEMLAENKEGNLTDKQKEFAQSIHTSGLDLLQLINDILDLSKVEAGKLDLDVHDFSLQKVIAEWERTFQATALKKGLAFKIEIDPSVPQSISSDSHRLSQIVKNFLSNSLKFTSSGEVRLQVGRASAAELAKTQLSGSHYIAFRVTDTGIGVPADKMLKIFQAFEQVDSSISRQYGGTGLGLAICLKLADLLGGEVLASSELGKGSTFTLLIPETITSATTDDSIKEVHSSEQNSPVQAATSSTILIIDDNDMLAAAFKAVATAAGYKIHVCGNGVDGLKYIETEKPMGVVLDSSLPDMPGVEILKQVKANPATSHIPVYMVSGDDHSAEAEQHGALGFLMKPTDSKDFLKALERMKLFSKGKKSRVLVVDDEETHLNHITLKLNSDQVEVTPVKSAEEAMKALESQGVFDCIVLDLRLSDMNGLAMLERLNEQKRHTPVIINTAIDLSKADEAKLRKYTESIIVKGERSSERLVDEVTLLLRKVKNGSAAVEGKSASLYGAETVFKGKHILIADDDDRNIFALMNALEAKGLKISFVHNGQEALNALSGQHSIDLVLMDVMMPVMDGLEALKHIRRKPRGHEIPVIALTAKAMKGSREACIAAGANDYLSKPVEMDRLLSLLRVWLAKK